MLPNSLTRYKITHLLWCALAKHPCKLRMGGLRRRFPESNWTTEASFDNMHALSVAVAGLRESMARHGWAASRHIQPGWSIKLPGVRWSVLLDVSSPGSPKRISLTILKSCSCEQCQRSEANSSRDQYQVEEHESLSLQEDLILERESETPRTDAECANNGIGLSLPQVRREHADRLEIELRAAHRKLAEVSALAASRATLCDDLVKRRDDVEKESSSYYDQLNSSVAKVETLTSKLDEANTLLKEARDGIKDTLTLLEKADFSHGVTDSSGNDEGNYIAGKYVERLQATVTKILKHQTPSQYE